MKKADYLSKKSNYTVFAGRYKGDTVLSARFVEGEKTEYVEKPVTTKKGKEIILALFPLVIDGKAVESVPANAGMDYIIASGDMNGEFSVAVTINDEGYSQLSFLPTPVDEEIDASME